MSRHVGFVAESSYGSPLAATSFAEAISETLEMQRTYEEIATVRGYSTRQVNVLTEHVQGSINMPGNPQELGLLLKHYYGSAVAVAGVGPYTHVFPAATGSGDRSGLSLTVEVRRDTDARTWRYAGCKVTGWTLSASATESPNYTFDFVGKSEAEGTAATASYSDFDPMTVGNTTFSWDGGSTGGDVESFTITTTREVNRPFAMGSAAFFVEPTDSDIMVVKGSVTGFLTDSNLAESYDKYDGTTVVDLNIAIDDGTHSLTLDMPTSRLTKASPGITGKEIHKCEFEWTSYYSAATHESMQATLVNDDSTDYA